MHDGEAAERRDGDLGRAATDVDDERPDWLADGEACADRGRHRLFDQKGVGRPRCQRGPSDGVALHLGDSARDADHHVGMRANVPRGLADEVAEHLLGHGEVRDHAVAQRPGRGDVRRRAADHPPRFRSDRVDVAGAFVDRDDGRLEEHDPLTSPEHHGVRRSEVNGELGSR